jgi:hypothetical protein
MSDDAKRLLTERAEQLRTTSGALDRTMGKVRRRLHRRRLSAGIVAAALSAGSLGFFFAVFLSSDPRPSPNEGDRVTESIEEFQCADDESLQNAPPRTDDPKMVGVYFSCGADAATLGTPQQPVYLAMRPIPAELTDTEEERLEGAVRAYIAGPTPEEQDRGYFSPAPSSLASAIREVRIDGSTAVLDFSPEVANLQLGNLGTTTATDIFVIELSATVFQFDGVDQLTLQVQGDCEKFWRLMERTCTVIERTAGLEFPDPSPPASEPPPKWEEGLFGKAEAEFPAGLGYVFENIWRQVIDGDYVAVYVGSRTSSDSMESTGEGVVLVKIIQPDTWKQDFFPVDAPIPGPLRIDSVDGHQLTVVSPSGEEAIFDVDTKQFL